MELEERYEYWKEHTLPNIVDEIKDEINVQENFVKVLPGYHKITVKKGSEAKCKEIHDQLKV